jgi:HAD superfamily hydrolase (TIGR01509 family)
LKNQPTPSTLIPAQQSTIKAVVFDMDGVLIDAKEWHFEALNQALIQLGYAAITRHDHETIFDGLPTIAKLRQMAKLGLLPHDETLFKKINQLKQLHTQKLTQLLCKPYKPHLDLLKALKKAGYRVGLASNSVRKTVDLMMALSGLAPYLDFTLSNEDVVNPKPASDIYSLAVEKLVGLEPTQCLAIEDNEKGIRAATGAGLHVLPVATVHDVTLANVSQQLHQLQNTQKTSSLFASKV